MDAQSFVEHRDHICHRIAARRIAISEVRHEEKEHPSLVSWAGPLLLQMGSAFLLRRSAAGLWPRAISMVAPVAFSMVKNLSFRSIFPLVKTVLNRL